MYLFLGALALIGVFLVSSKTSVLDSWPDVLPEDQGGSYDTSYDSFFKDAADRTGAPFALIKAHAIRESSLNPFAQANEPGGKTSYGLMQVLWWPGTDRFSKYGFGKDLVQDGSILFDASTNTFLGASIIRDNLDQYRNLRDAINAYNTGKSEAEHIAPKNYVNDVLKYYSTIVGRDVTS